MSNADFSSAWALDPRRDRLEDQGPLILRVICAVTVISTLASAGRLFVRGKIQGKLLLDDYLIIISVVSDEVAGNHNLPNNSFILKEVSLRAMSRWGSRDISFGHLEEMNS